MLECKYLVHMVHSPINVVADANIPFLEELLGDSVNLIRIPASDIDRPALKNADAVITRTRTLCNRDLLDGTPVKFIGTATIGTDHIDFDYCNQAGIKVVSAPGCNAPAVAQYVWSSILRLTRGINPADITVGIVGVGHVGRIVENWGRSMGYNILCCDPPRAIAEGPEKFVDLETIARKCDIITFHTPHTLSGPHATHHLADHSFFQSLQRSPIIINSARGPIVDTHTLLEAIDTGKVAKVVIDCWEKEPDINISLLDKAEIATPHIAGYSIEGKQRASLMVAQALAENFGLKFLPAIPMPGEAPKAIPSDAIIDSYDPYIDTDMLRQDPARFEAQRNHYKLRHEPSEK